MGQVLRSFAAWCTHLDGGNTLIYAGVIWVLQLWQSKQQYTCHSLGIEYFQATTLEQVQWQLWQQPHYLKLVQLNVKEAGCSRH